MKASPALKSTQMSSYEAIIERKNSLLKPPPIPQLELPRFYSTDEKLKKKHMIIQTEHHIPTSPQQPSLPTQPNTRKNASKYSKTEKNETPSRGTDASKPQKSNIIQEKLEEALLKRQQEHSNKPKIRQKKYDYHEILQTEKNQPTAGKKTTQNTYETTNQNKIRYKAQSRKSEGEFKLPKNTEDHNELPLNDQVAPKTIRQSNAKEQAKNPLKEKSKVVLRNEQMTEAIPQQVRKEVKLRTVSTFEAVRRGRLSEAEKEHLRTIQEVIRKTIKNPTNLDHPETYIVTDKHRFERRYLELLESRHQREYMLTLLMTRLAFYLCAHYILDAIPAKPLLALFGKVQEAHETIMSLLIGQDKSKGDKYFSIQKYSSKDLLQRGGRQKQGSEIAVETTGSNLPRVTEVMRRQITELVSHKGCVHGELFLRVLGGDVASMEQLVALDKELKWQILRMPTQPFLPPSLPLHRHFLILDLDETLIHFNPNREVFHVRPHAAEFLQTLSRYYQITVFTAATKEYADEIIGSIDRGGFISHRLYRNHLTFLMGESLKDISMLGRPLPTTLIVDNLQTNFRLHPNNGILIKSWYGAETDTILPKLQNLLIRISLEFPDDLRKGIALYANFISRQVAERIRGYKIKYDV